MGVRMTGSTRRHDGEKVKKGADGGKEGGREGGRGGTYLVLLLSLRPFLLPAQWLRLMPLRYRATCRSSREEVLVRGLA